MRDEGSGGFQGLGLGLGSGGEEGFDCGGGRGATRGGAVEGGESLAEEGRAESGELLDGVAIAAEEVLAPATCSSSLFPSH